MFAFYKMDLRHLLNFLLILLASIWQIAIADKVFARCSANSNVEDEFRDCQYCIGDQETCPSNYTCESQTIAARITQMRISRTLQIEFNGPSRKIMWSYDTAKADDVTITFYSWSNRFLDNCSNTLGSPLRGCCGVPLKSKSCKIEQCEDDSTIFWSVTVKGKRAASPSAAIIIERCDGKKRGQRFKYYCPTKKEDLEALNGNACVVRDLLTGKRTYLKVEYMAMAEHSSSSTTKEFSEICSFWLETSEVERAGKQLHSADDYERSFFGRRVYNVTVQRRENQIQRISGASLVQPITCQSNDFSAGSNVSLDPPETNQYICFFNQLDWPDPHVTEALCMPPKREYMDNISVLSSTMPKNPYRALWLIPVVIMVAIIGALLVVVSVKGRYTPFVQLLRSSTGRAARSEKITEDGNEEQEILTLPKSVTIEA